MQIANEVVPRAHKEIKLTPADEARFWKKVDKSAGPDACWLWTAGKTSRGNQVSGDAHHARTNPERMARGDRHGSRLHPERMSHGEAHSSAKLTAAQVVEIRNLYAKGQTTYSQLVTRYCISRSVISAIILRKNWKHV